MSDGRLVRRRCSQLWVTKTGNHHHHVEFSLLLTMQQPPPLNWLGSFWGVTANMGMPKLAYDVSHLHRVM